jgi:hypothetical protein
MNGIQKILLLSLPLVCYWQSEAVSETNYSDVNLIPKSEVVSITPPEGFINTPGSTAQIIGIISPLNGGFPEMNLVRTIIYPSNAKSKDWGEITLSYYKRLGFQDSTIQKSLNVDIKTTDQNSPYSMPTAVLKYSRGSQFITSMVGWIQLKDSDVVVTTKHNSSNEAQIEAEWRAFINGIIVNKNALKNPTQKQALGIYLLGIIAAALLLVIFINRRFRTT